MIYYQGVSRGGPHCLCHVESCRPGYRGADIVRFEAAVRGSTLRAQNERVSINTQSQDLLKTPWTGRDIYRTEQALL